MNTALDQQLKEAIGDLKRPSKTLEKAPSMSLQELQVEIDQRIDKITSGELTGKTLDHIKAEARSLALLKLRRTSRR